MTKKEVRDIVAVYSDYPIYRVTAIPGVQCAGSDSPKFYVHRISKAQAVKLADSAKWYSLGWLSDIIGDIEEDVALCLSKGAWMDDERALVFMM